MRQSLLLCVVGIILAGCASQTVFQSNFEHQPEFSTLPPQTVGTARWTGNFGSVQIVDSPVQTGPHWVQIGRANANSPLVGLQGNLINVPADGTYDFSTFLYVPARSGNRPGAQVATLQFERVGQPLEDFSSFLHIDLTQDNRVRINDDDATTFGTFKLDQVFALHVRLNINATPTAHISLSGADASGEADVPISGGNAALVARQFGALRLWVGIPWTGLFKATNIVVTHPK